MLQQILKHCDSTSQRIGISNPESRGSATSECSVLVSPSSHSILRSSESEISSFSGDNAIATGRGIRRSSAQTSVVIVPSVLSNNTDRTNRVVERNTPRALLRMSVDNSIANQVVANQAKS